MLKITAEEYLLHLGYQLSLKFTVTGVADGQSVTAMKGVDLQTPQLSMTVKHTHTHNTNEAWFVILIKLIY